MFSARRPLQSLALLTSLIVATAATAATAHAADPEVDRLLDQARREKAALQYQQALATLDQTLRLGRSDPAELTTLFRLAGEVAAGLDDDAAATAHFEHLLSLAPDATLPDGTSPKLTAPFDAARAWLAAHGPLRIRFDATPGPTPTLVMLVESDPLALVAGARVRVRTVDGVESVVFAGGTTRAELAFADAARHGPLHVVASAVDQFGNALVVHGTWDVPIVIGTDSDAAAATHHRRARPSFVARWPLWSAVGLAFGLAGGYFGLEARAAQSDFDALVADSANHSYDEARAIADRGDRAALFANIGFVAAGAATAVAVVLLVRELRRSGSGSADRTDDRGPILTPAPTPGGGAALVFDYQF